MRESDFLRNTEGFRTGLSEKRSREVWEMYSGER